ncbi:MAG: hypothetical protein U0K57_02085 [Lachnospiraceae bacterium]|nr:hypothetical protein [Lachnospiraceae bacterium]
MITLKGLLEAIPNNQVIQLDIWNGDETIYTGTKQEMEDFHIEIEMQYEDYELAQVTSKVNDKRDLVIHILMFDYLGHEPKENDE